MKKIWKMAAVMALGCMMIACGNNAIGLESVQNESEMNVEETSVTEASMAETEEPVVEKMVETVAESVAPSEAFVADRSEMFTLVKDMKIGWNLGNTFDAHGQKHSMNDETYWGNPLTTKEMIQAVAAKGFKTLRMPVTWHDHVGTAPEYTIDTDWLERVKEVVDWALEEDMYVIIDTHHEPDYWLKPQADMIDEVDSELAAIWLQVADYFADYDSKLLFEGMNEPRVKGSEKEWSGGDKDGRDAVNRLNQTFVDSVRSTGGNNATRPLIICTYGNSVTYSTMTETVIPEDNNIILAVHLYTPYFFTYHQDNDNNVETWDGSLKKDIISNMQLVDKEMISKGVPVIITEFGAVNDYYVNAQGETVSNREEVLKWLQDYMETANRFGMTCIWWDNNIYDADGEQFSIFDRRNVSWYAEDIADALIDLAWKDVE